MLIRGSIVRIHRYLNDLYAVESVIQLQHDVDKNREMSIDANQLANVTKGDLDRLAHRYEYHLCDSH